MRTLVIGGTLYIGKLLVEKLLASGHEVTIVHRKPGLPDARCEELIADRNDAGSLRAAVGDRRFDVVFDNVYDWERGTTAEQVADTARIFASGLHRYVFISSVAAYSSGLNHRESDPLAREDDPDPYVRNKAASERALFRLHHQGNLPVVTFRPPFVYGRGNPFYREAFFWDRMRSGRPIIVPNDGSRLMQFVLAEDLVQAMLESIERPEAVGQAFNVANPEPIAQADLVRALAEAAGVTVRLVFVPRQKLLDAGGNAMAPPLYFGTYYDLPPITENTEKAQRLLGFRATPFLEGLHAQWQEYAQHPPKPFDASFEDQFLI